MASQAIQKQLYLRFVSWVCQADTLSMTLVVLHGVWCKENFVKAVYICCVVSATHFGIWLCRIVLRHQWPICSLQTCFNKFGNFQHKILALISVNAQDEQTNKCTF